MSSRSRGDSVKTSNNRITPPTHATALSNLSPFSTLTCQVEATNAWRKDLKSLYSRASERFADVCWSTSTEDENGSLTDDEGVAPSWVGSSRSRDSVIWAHKAILYARAPNTFQARFLHLRPPAANLGAMASSSTVSLPVLRAPSPSTSFSSRNSSAYSVKRRTLRGAAPPSSFSMSRTGSKGAANSYTGTSDSEAEEGPRTGRMTRTPSNSSLSSSIISGPISRGERRQSQHGSHYSDANRLSPSLTTESDSLSVLSSTSTVKAPMGLDGVSQVFFEATLEYLYTAEESMKEAFEFLYEDRVAADEGTEVRLEKLRQDLVFMWRSRLYSDIEIVIGEEDERTVVRTIPDVNASVTSFALQEAADDDEEQTASFSAHRMMLVSRSPYFASQLLSSYADASTRVIRLPSPPFTPAALHFTLGFIYTGTLFFSNRTFDLSTAFQLWRAASYLQMDTLSTLVSSLINHDFCHGFACSPPCKTCVKRIPRTLGFASSPDVHDAHLQVLARNAASGDNFGSYWAKEVGNLDYTVRGALVSDVCSKVDARPGYTIHALRQLSIIGTRIDTERSSRWVDAVRWMCESIESHVCSVMEVKLAEVIASDEWRMLIEGVGFLNDILEKALSIIVDGLTEKRAARVYEVLVGQVLLREDGLPTQDITNLVEEARKTIVRYLQKRWVNVRVNAGFNGIENWALKELADEIDVPVNELILPDRAKAGVRGTKAASQSPEASTQRERNSPGTSPHLDRPSPGQIVAGEREAGPIHLRAAVLNRNAARASVVHGFRTSSGQTSSTAGRSTSDGSSIMNRPRRSMGSPPSRAQDEASSTTASQQRAPSIRSSARSNTARQPADASPPSRAPSTSESTSGNRASASPRTPTASLRSVETSQADADLTPTRRTSPSVAAFRSASQQRSRANPPTESSVQKRQSETSLRPSPSTSKLQQPTTAPALRTMRSRQTSTSSVVSSSASSMRRASGGSSSTAGTSTAAGAHKTVRKVVSSKTLQKRREEAPAPPLPAQAPKVLRDITLRNGDQMQLDSEEATSSSCINATMGTQLVLGIPCVIAPRNKAGKVTRFRAVVKYIGPLTSAGAEALVGVEVPLPLPTGLDEGGYEFHDGRYRGVRYFDVGQTNQFAEGSLELSHKPEREARRLRLAQMMQGRQTTEAASAAVGPSTKRRKDLTGAGLSLPVTASRGLFILPSEVLWVVI